MKYIAELLFGITVVFLRVLAWIFRTDYYTVNIWFYCIIGPLFFMLLATVLWLETACGIVTDRTGMNIFGNILLSVALVAIAVVLGRIFLSAMPVFHSLAAGNKTQLFQNCVDYLNLTRGNISYVDINVWYFCLLGPLIYLVLIFLDIAGLHQFHWHWLALFHEPHAWRYWLNAIILLACIPASRYALFVLKRYVMIRG